MSISLVYLLYLPVFCCKYVNKLRLLVQGHTKIPGGECQRHGIRVKDKTERFRCICSNWGFQHWCQQMHRWTTVFPVCMHSGFPARRSKQTIVTSWNDVTMISHAIVGGNYKRRAHPNLSGCHLGFLTLNGWVYWQVTDPLLWLSWCLFWSRA